ncbi:DUF5324 family protein [Streptomyces sp. NBC_00669]|uniref:DUF5324 family protein n=1 Tax=unclassified Streptomyces TaxID=2593676 RepID=UPI002E376A2B|nr:DUF5324 family protein [Streptomyces sp. NBC_00669]
MTRIDSVRHAADVTKDSVRHAAEVAAPYATTAKENAVVYGRQYGRQAGVYGRQAGAVARQQYEAKLAPRVGQARDQAWAAVPPKAASAVETAARRTADGAKAATEYTAPKVGTAVAATRSVAGPAKDEVVLRGAAALQALRGQVSATDIDRLVRRRVFRRKAGRTARDVVLVAVCCGAAVAAWRWWNKQNNPEWLVEPSEATDVADRASMNGSATLTVVDPLDGGSVNGSSAGSASTIDHVDGSAGAGDLDDEVRAKQAEADRKREEGDQ